MCEPPRHRRDGTATDRYTRTVITVKGKEERSPGPQHNRPAGVGRAWDAQPPGREAGQRHFRGDSFGGDIENGTSSSSASWKVRREPPQTAQSSGSSQSSSSFAAASGLAPIVRHSSPPSRLSSFITSAGVASHSGGVGARRGLCDVGRRCGEGTSMGFVCGISVAFDSCVFATCSGFTRVASIAATEIQRDTFGILIPELGQRDALPAAVCCCEELGSGAVLTRFLRCWNDLGGAGWSWLRRHA